MRALCPVFYLVCEVVCCARGEILIWMGDIPPVFCSNRIREKRGLLTAEERYLGDDRQNSNVSTPHGGTEL